MYEVLESKINEVITLTPDEFEYCKTLFIPKKLRKRQYMQQEGDVSRHVAFIEKGTMRSYTVDEKGADHILQFGLEGWWMGDLASFLSGEPSVFNIDALEESELLLLTKASWDLLLEKIPKFERYFRILIQNNLIATQNRLMYSMTQTAESKYENLINSFPGCLERVPQHMIASYLGITRETLSRIRRQRAKRK